MNLYLNLAAVVAPGIIFYALLHYGAPSFVTISYLVASALFALVEALGILRRRSIRQPRQTSGVAELIGSA